MRVRGKQGGKLVLFFVLYLAFGSVTSLYFDESTYHDYDSAAVVLTHTEYNHRHRRSADVMPDEIHVTMTSGGTGAKLRLKRNSLAALNVPVFTLTKGDCIEQQTQNLLDFARSGFYQDLSSGASLFVRRTDRFLQPFDLEGPLRINGSEFLLTPSRELLPMDKGGRAHRLKRIMTTINFGHDFMDERNPLDIQLRTLRALQRKGYREDRIRAKRQAPVTHTVELTIVADYKIFERFLKYTKGNRNVALSELKLYYIFMTNLMDIRYRSVTTLDPSLIIRVAMVSLVVTDVRAEAVWTEGNKLRADSVNAERALYSFRDWLRVNTKIPRADHWMLFSGYDLAEASGTTATIGIAFIGTLCTGSAVSVVEEYFTATSGAVSAHELGHSLDADHDAMYTDCSDDASHVMSTIATFPREESRASNPWRFSTCSVDAFGAYLDTVRCALRPPPRSISTRETGGLYLDADEQCQLAMGSGSYFCRTVQSRLGWNLSCRRLYCYLPDDPGFCASIVPQEYTSCNNKKWCELGKCVTHRDAPATIWNCPQGDDKEYNCRAADCSDTKVRNAYCCRTCAERRGVTVSASSPVGATSQPLRNQPPALPPSSTAATTVKPTPPARVLTTTDFLPTPTTRATTLARRLSTTTRDPTTAVVRIPTTTTTTTTTGQTGLPFCTDFACQCQRRWSVFCFFYYRG